MRSRHSRSSQSPQSPIACAHDHQASLRRPIQATLRCSTRINSPFGFNGFRSVGRLTDANSATLTWCVNTLKTLPQPSGTALGKCSAQTPKAVDSTTLQVAKVADNNMQLQPIACLAMHVLGVLLHCFDQQIFFALLRDSLMKNALESINMQLVATRTRILRNSS